jgi:hypothetical protein
LNLIKGNQTNPAKPNIPTGEQNLKKLEIATASQAGAC